MAHTTPLATQLCGLLFATVTFLGGHLFASDQTPTLSPIVLDGDLPYEIQVAELDFGNASLPTLQSFAVGIHEGQWLLVAGRTNGLHNFTNDGLQNFPPASQNKNLWVIDPVKRRVWSRALDATGSGLSISQVDSLSATAAESVQIKNRLYIVGGYVYDRTADNFTTYDTLTALDLGGVIDWVKTGNGTLVEHLRQTQAPILQVTGGDLYLTDATQNRVLLIFGQNFEGPYTPTSNGVYTQQVRAFDIVDDGTTLSIANPARSVSSPDYRRRDLNIVPAMHRAADGSVRHTFTALSGVFTLSGGVWTVPVEITAKGKPSMKDPTLASTFKQGMNSYNSAKVGLYSKRTNSSHHVLFGGISLETFDTATGKIVYDANVPFVNDISSVVRGPAGHYRQYYLGKFPSIPNPSNNNAPFLFGAVSTFVPTDTTPVFANGMVRLDALKVPTQIGYVFGGIIAEQANFGTSAASNYLFTVTFVPKLTFSIDGSRQIAVDSGTATIRGLASAPSEFIESQIGGLSSQSAVANNGRWAVPLTDLPVGVTEVQLRVVGGGNNSAFKKVTITRK